MTARTPSNPAPDVSSQGDSTGAVLCFGDIHGHRAAAEAAVSLSEDLGVPAVFMGDININTRSGFGGHLAGLLLEPLKARCLRSWQISEAGEIRETTDSLMGNL